ncbi:MAG: hypothetical protein HY043_23630 [Verrucomicrobia bacterium]|nr:hypothetical protein [Verrucomicrobiota bacterium]
MNDEVWQQLLSLESRDVTAQWFERIHANELNARRAKEINSAAKQAREYFRGAFQSQYSVRPLLTFYGVACLSRAVLLLLRRSGGEETLTGSHGLETANWGQVMSGETANSLRCLLELRVRTTAGLFHDFVTQTENRTSIHVRSSKVDWRICYDVPEKGDEVSLGDLLARIPDLHADYSSPTRVPLYAAVNEMTYSEDAGFNAKVRSEQFTPLKPFYEQQGFTVTPTAGCVELSADSKTFQKRTPLFVHSYVHKTFGSIPTLHMAQPFPSDSCYSQLSITYMVSYILGMLVRYYPTHWMALIQGDKGDTCWPTINRAQHFVEQSFPEVAIELVHDILNNKAAESAK